MSTSIGPRNQCVRACVRACVRTCVRAGGRAGGRACVRASYGFKMGLNIFSYKFYFIFKENII